MALVRMNNDYRKYSDPDLLEKARYIHQQVSSRATMFPTPTPAMLAFKDGIDEFSAAVTAAGTGDRILGGQKRATRAALVTLMQQLGYYVLMTANGDKLIAEESGFTLAKESTNVTIYKPTDLKLEYTSQIGEVQTSVKPVKGAAAYLHQYTSDPTLKEESWVTMNCTSARCKITGLTPGTMYYFRVGVVGSKEQVLYSDVQSKIGA